MAKKKKLTELSNRRFHALMKKARDGDEKARERWREFVDETTKESVEIEGYQVPKLLVVMGVILLLNETDSENEA